MAVHVEETRAADGNLVFTICSTWVDRPAPIELDAFVAELRRVGGRLMQLRLSGCPDAGVMVMLEPHVRVALTLRYKRADDDIFGTPAPDEAANEHRQVVEQAQAMVTRLQAGMDLGREQARRIAARPDMHDAHWRTGFPPTQVGIDAQELLRTVRCQPQMQAEIGAEKVVLGGLEHVPRHMPTGQSFIEHGWIPVMVDTVRRRVEFSAFSLDESASATEGPQRFELQSRPRKSRLVAAVPDGKEHLANLLALACWAKAPVEVLLARYRATDAKGERLVVMAVQNENAIRAAATRALREPAQPGNPAAPSAWGALGAAGS